MSLPYEFPLLQEGEYAVICADATTGIVLTPHGTPALSPADVYRTFRTRQEALEHARALVLANPLWEGAVFDREGNVIETYRDEDALRALVVKK